MRLVVVNHMHPDTPHVSGMRAWCFSRELAAHGHSVILICEFRDGAAPTPYSSRLPEILDGWDRRDPLVLAIRPERSRLLDAVRSDETPAFFRKVLVVISYLKNGGMFTDFHRGAEAILPVLATRFQPEIVWGIYGNSDCWAIARRLAQLAGCNWVADMKDAWESTMPQGIRRVISWRFRDMTAATSNSESNTRSLERWFHIRASTVYSGVADCFFPENAGVPSSKNQVRIVIVGSISSVQLLKSFSDGVFSWFRGHAPSDGLTLEIIYAGGDHDKAQFALDRLREIADVRIHSYLPLETLAEQCRSATVSAYVRNPRGFHHKLMELLACGRPILTIGQESEESHRLADIAGGRLYECADPAGIARVLECVTSEAVATATMASRLKRFSWAAQAEILERVFQSACVSP